MPYRRCSPRCVPPCRLASAVVAALLPTMAWAAPNVEFNPQFLQGEQAGSLDLSRFERGEALPGTYSADIKVNGVIVARREVELRALDNDEVVICLSPQVMEVLGVDPVRLPRQGQAMDAEGMPVEVRPLPDAAFCDPLADYIPQAVVHFDAGEQVLGISIPQAYLAHDPRGWVSPELWDDGMDAVLLGYSISHQCMQGSGHARQSTGAMLNAGLNLGAWRIRHDGYFSRSSASGSSYRGGRTYAQRSIAPWGVELLVGESSTRGDLFEGVNFRGVGIATDPRMLPDSQRDYAPVVRGVAQTNARVVIRQRGNVLYQANVAAGPFEINDLYGTAYAGDLDVEIIENDGRSQRFTVPFAAVPQLLRAGQQRFAVSAGMLRDDWLHGEPMFVEATLRHGLGNRLTAYGGVAGSDGYRAVLAGGAFNTAAGAFSGDITVSRTALPGELAGFGRSMQGQSYRLGYSKSIAATDTTLSMAAHRYSVDGYLTLNEANRLRQQLATGGDGNLIARQRSRLELAINQRLGERGGSLYASGSSMDYWNLEQRRTNFAVGYSSSISIASYSVSAQRSLERTLGSTAAREGNSLYFNLSIPLGARSGAPRVNASVNHRSDGRDDVRAGINGSFGERRQGSYSAAASRHGGQGNSYDAGVNYQASIASLSGGYSHSPGSRGLSLGAGGGVVVHAGGVSFSQQLGDTIALVHVPDAAGATLDSTVGVRTNARGDAVVPYMTPFRRNEVTIDPRGLPMDVELKSASVVGIPTAGAVVRLVVPTSNGRSALIEAPLLDGSPLPFGVDVYDEAGDAVGVVGQASRLWVRGIEEKGQLTVRWGSTPARQCVIDFDLASAVPGAMLAGQCREPEETVPSLQPAAGDGDGDLQKQHGRG